MELHAAAQDLISKSVAPATRRVYRKAVQGLVDFCDQHNIKDKFSANSIELYVSWLAGNGMKSNSIRSMLSAVRHHCNSTAVPITFDTPRLLLLLKGVRRCNDTKVLRPKNALKLRQLVKLCKSAEKLLDFKLAAMVRAVFSLSFFALLRPSEASLASTSPEHQLKRTSVKIKTNKVKVTFGSFKHSDGSATISVEKKPFAVCPVVLLLTYLSTTHLESQNQPLFPCSTIDVNSWLQRCVLDAGITSKLTMHSFRRGGATWYSGQGLTDATLRALGRWKSSAYLCYVKP